MKVYIVKVYRHNGEDLGRLVGVVEDVETSGKTPFHSTDELVTIIKGAPSGERRFAGRMRLCLPVRVSGENTKDERFSENVKFKDISSQGAFFEMQNPVEKNARLHMVIDPGRSNLITEAMVARTAHEWGKHGVGVCFE
jgi:hypothetical protein